MTISDRCKWGGMAVGLEMSVGEAATYPAETEGGMEGVADVLVPMVLQTNRDSRVMSRPR